MTEFRPGRFEILPTVIKNLLIINALVFLAQNVLPKDNFNLENLFALHTWQSSLFKPWQFVTYMFMHGSFDHILSNMFALWMFGSILENVWGPKRFLLFYIVSGLGAALCHMLVLFYENQLLINEFNAIQSGTGDALQRLVEFIDRHNLRNGREFSLSFAHIVLNDHLNNATLGASGAVFGCLAAFGYLFPNAYIYLYFLLPIKVKWFVLAYAAFELYAAIQNSAGDTVAHIAHLGGAVAGFFMVYFWNKNNRKTFY